MGIATDSLVSEGCIISGGQVDCSVLSPGVRVNSFARVEQSILMDGVDVGRVQGGEVHQGAVAGDSRDRSGSSGEDDPLHAPMILPSSNLMFRSPR